MTGGWIRGVHPTEPSQTSQWPKETSLPPIIHLQKFQSIKSSDTLYGQEYKRQDDMKQLPVECQTMQNQKYNVSINIYFLLIVLTYLTFCFSVANFFVSSLKHKLKMHMKNRWMELYLLSSQHSSSSQENHFSLTWLCALEQCDIQGGKDLFLNCCHKVGKPRGWI